MKLFYKYPAILFSLFLVIGFTTPNNGNKSSLKVMTYNIWNGFDWGKDLDRKNNCIKWIASQKPDVVTLQELCGYTDEMLAKDALEWGHEYTVLLKTSGYSTGITSNQPIKLVEKVLDPFWHGLLHCQTYGIDFFVVHFSPADCDFRLKEAKLVSEKIKNLENDHYIISGDFNSFSPFDAYYLEKKESLRAKRMPKPDSKYSNLRLGEFDYAPIAQILGSPAIDLCLNRLNLEDSFTFPTLALDGLYENTIETIQKNSSRIDYILASPKLAKKCEDIMVYNGKETSQLSDHFPVMAEFSLEK